MATDTRVEPATSAGRVPPRKPPQAAIGAADGGGRRRWPAAVIENSGSPGFCWASLVQSLMSILELIFWALIICFALALD